MSTPTIVPSADYRIKALTQLNLEKLCTIVHRHGQTKLAAYDGLTVTDEVSSAMTGEAVEGAETLRLALITAGHERAREMDLSGIEAYYKRNVARR